MHRCVCIQYIYIYIISIYRYIYHIYIYIIVSINNGIWHTLGYTMGCMVGGRMRYWDILGFLELNNLPLPHKTSNWRKDTTLSRPADNCRYGKKELPENVIYNGKKGICYWLVYQRVSKICRIRTLFNKGTMPWQGVGFSSLVLWIWNQEWEYSTSYFTVSYASLQQIIITRIRSICKKHCNIPHLWKNVREMWVKTHYKCIQ